MLQCISPRAVSHTVTELMQVGQQISGHCNLVYLKAINNYIINNNKVIYFTTICGIYGLNSKN